MLAAAEASSEAKYSDKNFGLARAIVHACAACKNVGQGNVPLNQLKRLNQCLSSNVTQYQCGKNIKTVHCGKILENLERLLLSCLC